MGSCLGHDKVERLRDGTLRVAAGVGRVQCFGHELEQTVSREEQEKVNHLTRESHLGGRSRLELVVSFKHATCVSLREGSGLQLYAILREGQLQEISLLMFEDDPGKPKSSKKRKTEAPQ
jgi:hypothetical protein